MFSLIRTVFWDLGSTSRGLNLHVTWPLYSLALPCGFCAELLHGRVLGEAAVVLSAVAETTIQRHQKPRPLQSSQ